MFFRSWLSKLWCYFRYYIWMFLNSWSYYPSLSFYSRYRRRLSSRTRVLKRTSSALFWSFVSFVEHSPERFRGAVKGVYLSTKRFILSFSVTQALLSVGSGFFKIYFSIVSFRSLLCLYILLDYFIYRWSDQGIDNDLRMWNLCMLCAFFNILYMLMDASDKSLTLNSHDFLTSIYFKHYLGTEPGRVLTNVEMSDPSLSRYIKIRYKRNAYLAIIGFFYTGQPLFSSYG